MATVKHGHAERRGSIRAEEALFFKVVLDDAPEYPASTDAVIVILALSIVANNCPNIYSVSLTLMVLGRWTRRVPRFVWTIVGSAVYVGIAIPGYASFEAVLENFMHFIGYWFAIYEGIALTDHFVFRRGFSGYNPEHWDDGDKLPPSYASLTSSLMGIVGMVLGMKQTWIFKR
ncbi:hypothetical protein EsDP_00006709 [Epichloe bromicola]|uniref:Uncharacterized protein n=1 Tax=Epichloe bromicola TaxID=79588 RepID=A0ABQ0CYE5_9HYPO